MVSFAEADTAVKTKKLLGDNSKNILLYSPTHHGYNNDSFSVNLLNINNDNTAFVIANTSAVSAAWRRQKSYYHTSSTVRAKKHFYTLSGVTTAGNGYNAIIVNFLNDGTIDVKGSHYKK